MSDDFHRPTYTTKDPHDAFNATQVRLYGIPGLPREQKDQKMYEKYDPKKMPNIQSYIYAGQTALILARLLPDDPPPDRDVGKYINEIPLIKDTQSSFLFVNSIVDDYMVMIGTLDLYPDEDEKARNCKKKKIMTSGIIFAYAYEGHTYELPKPKIMLIPVKPEKEVPRDDSGYDRKNYADYTVWIVDKLDQCVEFEMNQGFVEQLVLEANLPGKRSPTMYASKAALGHRGGKMME